MSAPEPLREEKPVSKAPSKPNGGESLAPGRKKALAGADLAPGGAADMAMAPDADGRLAKLDQGLLYSLASQLRKGEAALKSAHSGARAAFTGVGPEFEQVAIEASRLKRLVTRLDGLLEGLTPDVLAGARNVSADLFKALADARDARLSVDRCVNGLSGFHPPRGLPAQILGIWESEATRATQAIGSLKGALTGGAPVHDALDRLRTRLRKEKEQALAERVARNRAAKAARGNSEKEEGEAGRDEGEAVPEPARESAPETESKVSDAKHDASANRGGGLVKADANLFTFKRARITPRPGGWTVQVDYFRGDKPQTLTLGSVRGTEFQEAQAAGASWGEVADGIANRIVETLRTRVKRLDIDEKDVELARRGVVEALNGLRSGDHVLPAL